MDKIKRNKNLNKNKLHNTLLNNDVPDSVELLSELRNIVDNYTSDITLTPPMSQEEILTHSEKLISLNVKFSGYQKLIAVLINNKAWEPIVAEIPFEKRILLIPKCFRNTEKCEAQFDELGLLCEVCGNCYNGDIITKAEKVGYNVIVSEGTTTVSMLLSSQQIECVIGISCLDSFERTFPLAVKHAIPAIALPLFNSDCKDSKVDEVWVDEICNIKTDCKKTNFINIDETKKTISSWFDIDILKTFLVSESKTEQIGLQWLSSGGKHWRPLLTASIYKVLSGNEIVNNQSLITLCIAVECFHKASLIHDDIADNDLERYGKPVLHREFDIPIALNLGDLLLAYGYELINQTNFTSDKISKLAAIASRGHKNLCIGQGEELFWRHNSDHLSVEEIIYIFKMKTAPAFEVALKFGAVAAGASDEILTILKQFSEKLGVLYQIKDDIEDYIIEAEKHDFSILRPSLIYSLTAKKDPGSVNKLFSKIKNGDVDAAKRFSKLVDEYNVIAEAKEMMEKYKTETLSTLEACTIPSVKILLYRLVNKIIYD